MRARDAAGLALAPVFLRAALACVFILAGLTKINARMDVSGETAAILANYAIIKPARGQTPTLPPPELPPADNSRPAPNDDPEAPPADNDQPADEPITLRTDQPRAHAVAYQSTTPAYTAADFPEPVSVRQVAGLVLLLHDVMHPSADESGNPKMKLWPDIEPANNFDPWPVRSAWAVALTELIAGILIGIGLLTRLSALSLVVVMGGAMWLTEIGPAIRDHNTMLAILPKRGIYDAMAWTTLLFQLTLFCASMALTLAGPGTLSADRLLMGGGSPSPRRDDDDDEEDDEEDEND